MADEAGLAYRLRHNKRRCGSCVDENVIEGPVIEACPAVTELSPAEQCAGGNCSRRNCECHLCPVVKGHSVVRSDDDPTAACIRGILEDNPFRREVYYLPGKAASVTQPQIETYRAAKRCVD